MIVAGGVGANLLLRERRKRLRSREVSDEKWARCLAFQERMRKRKRKREAL